MSELNPSLIIESKNDLELFLGFRKTNTIHSIQGHSKRQVFTFTSACNTHLNYRDKCNIYLL